MSRWILLVFAPAVWCFGMALYFTVRDWWAMREFRRAITRRAFRVPEGERTL